MTVFHKKLKGSAMLWCVIIMSILALVVMVSVSVAAAYDRSVARSVCLNQLEYDAESALKVACSRICNGKVYSDENKPEFPILKNGESEVFFDNGTAMGTVLLNWDKDENILTATAYVTDYGECSVSAVLEKKEKLEINSISFPEIDDERNQIIYESTTLFTPDHYYYTLDNDLHMEQLEEGGVYYFKGELDTDIDLSFGAAGNSPVITDIYILLTHSQKLTINNIPPNVRLFVFPASGDTDNEAEVTIVDTNPVKGFISCGTLNTQTDILPETPDENIVSFTKGYFYEFVRYKD